MIKILGVECTELPTPRLSCPDLRAFNAHQIQYDILSRTRLIVIDLPPTIARVVDNLHG